MAKKFYQILIFISISDFIFQHNIKNQTMIVFCERGQNDLLFKLQSKRDYFADSQRLAWMKFQ